jgi:predicted MFS family arabinose efflux permease
VASQLTGQAAEDQRLPDAHTSGAERSPLLSWRSSLVRKHHKDCSNVPDYVTSQQVHVQAAAATRTRGILAGLVAATFLSLLHYLSFSPLLPAIAADLRVDIGLLGQLPAAIGLGAAGIGLVAGPFADQYGKRRTLLLGLLALVVSSASLAFVSGALMLLPVVLLAAVGRATVYPLALAIATAEYEGDDQRKAVSRITSSLGVAPIVGVPLVTSVAALLDWRTAWLALAIVTALALLCLYKLLATGSARSRDVQPVQTVRQLALAYGLLIRHRPSLALLGGTFMMGAGGWAVWTYLGAFLVRQHGFTTQEAGWAWTIVGLGLFLGTVLAGGRLGRAPLDVLFTVAGLGAGVCLGLAFVLSISGWLAVGLIAAGTLLHGVTQVVTAILLPNAAPTGRAATMTLRGAASSLGSATGAAVGGLLLQGSGFANVGVSVVAFCVVGAAMVSLGRMHSPRAGEHHPRALIARPLSVFEPAKGR